MRSLCLNETAGNLVSSTRFHGHRPATLRLVTRMFRPTWAWRRGTGGDVRQAASGDLTPSGISRLDKDARLISNCDVDLAGVVTEPVPLPPLGVRPPHARIRG